MSNCTPPRTPFSGTGKIKESGFLATHKQDFLAHASGEAFRHCADQINMNPSLTTILGDNVQEVLENIELLLGGTGSSLFVSIGAGDGYAVGDYNVGVDGITSLEDAFAAAFVNPHVTDGGIIVLKTGSYSMTTTVNVPSGITIWGETGGVVINGRMNDISPMFRILSADTDSRFDLGGGQIASTSSKYTKLWNLVLVSNLNSESSLGLASAPMISVDDGAVCRIDRVSLFGQYISGTNTTDLCAIASNALVTTTEPTILEIDTCIIDNFSCGINFNPSMGDIDHLTVKNCKIRHTGTNATKEYKYGISSNYVNLDISNNFCFGENSIVFDSYGFIYIRPEMLMPSSIDIVRVNVNENSGGLGDSASQQELLNLIDFGDFKSISFSGIKIGSFDKNNTWGYCTGSTSLPIVVGTGDKGSFGDINGVFALNFLINRYNIDAVNSAVDYSAPLVYLLPGFYIVNTNVNRTALSLEGIVQFNNGLFPYPVIDLEMSSGSYLDEFGKYTLSIAGYIKNIIVYSGSENSLTINQIESTKSAIRFDNTIAMDSCKFYVPVNIRFGGNEYIDDTSTNTDGYDIDKNIGVARNCSFHKTYAPTTSGRKNVQQVYLRANTGTFSFDDCNFSGNGYALFVDGYSDSESNKARLVSVNNCKFDVYSGNTSVDGYILVDDFATAPTSWEPHYIHVNLTDDYDSITFNNCQINMVKEKGQGADLYSYCPVDQTIIEIYDPSAIYIKSPNIYINHCNGDGPDQARENQDSELYAFWHLDFKGNCLVENCYFRGSFPMLITGGTITSSTPVDYSTAPSVNISKSKFRHYYRPHVMGGSVFGTFSLLCIKLPDWTNNIQIPALLAGTASVNIDGCSFSQEMLNLPEVNQMRICITGLQSDSIYSTIIVRAGGWGVGFVNNTVLSNHAQFHGYISSVNIYVRQDGSISNNNRWHDQLRVINNQFSLSSMMYEANYSKHSVCLNVTCSSGIISNNIFNFLNPTITSNSFDETIIGWLITNVFDGILNISNNYFNSVGNIPNYGIGCEYQSGAKNIFTNNIFNPGYTNQFFQKKFVKLINLGGYTAQNEIYFEAIFPGLFQGADTNSLIASDTSGDWGQIKIYKAQ
jgi:hypothetical protein